MPSKVLNCFLACLRSIPVIFITAILLWSYYAYVFQLCLFTIDSVAEKVLYIIFYHPIAILLAWSYWKAIFTPIATPPKEFFLELPDVERLQQEVDRANRKEILDQVAKNLPIHCRLISGEVRYCEKCSAIKPDRAHHCSICGKCVLKMDHHCPWVNNCVCFSNYKFFLLFLGYSMIYCLYVGFTSLQYIIHFFQVGAEKYGLQGLHIVFLFIASVLFAVCVAVLFAYHCYLVAYNKSTIESTQPPVLMNGPNENAFNIGCKNNFFEVFGERKLFWFLPIFTSYGDGCSYPSNCYPSSPTYQSLNSTTSITISGTLDGATMNGMAFSKKAKEDDVHSLLGRQQSDGFEDTAVNQGYYINNVSGETS